MGELSEPLLKDVEESDEEKEEEKEEEDVGASLSRGRKIAMAVSVAGGFSIEGVLFSTMPPFYPSVAEARGLTPAQYGFVFGVAHLSAMLASPFFASWTSRLGPRRVFLLGTAFQFLGGGILFGLLEHVRDPNTFLWMSYVLRCLFGLGDAASYSAVLGVTMSLFPSRAATLLGSCETTFGAGYTIGPAVGTFLYMSGGFQLPFILPGALGLLIGAAQLASIPWELSTKGNSSRESAKSAKFSSPEREKLTLSKVLRSPPVWLPMLDYAAVEVGYGFVESMLEPHARDALGFSQPLVGAAFLVMAASYMAQTPIFGHLADSTDRRLTLSSFSALGNLLMSLSMALLGPISSAPLFLGEKSPTAAVFAAVAVQGSANAVAAVFTYARSQAAVERLGFRQDLDTYLLLSGLWIFSFYLGNFVGPTVSGLMVQWIGFRRTAAAFAVFYLFMTISDLVEFACQTKRK